MVQQLRPCGLTAGGKGLIPSGGTKDLACRMAQPPKINK